MPEIDDQKWFEAQCLEQGICAEDIFVMGDYATNKEGDFLYSVTHEEGEDTMNFVAACDLADCESNYAEWLLNLMQNLEDNYYEGDMSLGGSQGQAPLIRLYCERFFMRYMGEEGRFVNPRLGGSCIGSLALQSRPKASPPTACPY